jgi:threonine/homoserine/homoserine lactone efflux protein
VGEISPPRRHPLLGWHPHPSPPPHAGEGAGQQSFAALKYSTNNHAIYEMASRPLARYKRAFPLTSLAMPHFTSLLGFALVSLGMVLTPGPNMIYLISRSITQGRAAGLISLGGVALGFVFYMLCAAFGITALLFAVPYAYDALRFGGALYLLWLAWQVLKPNGRSPFQVRELAVDGPRKLFAMGFITNLLNPKIAMLYLALLPQFIDPSQGSVLLQSIVFGLIQIVISVSVNTIIAVTAGSITGFLSTRPMWLKAQRWLMGTVLAGFALKMAFEAKRA